MERYNGILCISYSELVTGGIISDAMYDKCCNRKKFQRVRRACRDTEALIAVKSLPTKILAKVKELHGDDLDRLADDNTIRGSYVQDSKALEFYRNYRYGDNNEKALSEEKIDEYVTNASILMTVKKLADSRTAYCRSKGGTPHNLWEDMSTSVNNVRNTFKHTLPSNPRRLKEKIDELMKNGYGSLVSGKMGNSNTEKIPEDAKLWLLTRWSDQVNKCTGITQLFCEYNEKADEVGTWNRIKSDVTIRNFLYREDIVSLWYSHRYGELQAKEKFCYQHSTLLPTMRDSLWYSDGTKLNYYYRYQDASGKWKVGTLNVYEVVDAYSEMFLGYHISKSEDYEAQYFAYKMAMSKAQYKPYQITYDNQGGHKKLENGEFLSRLAHISIRTQPYNGKSKTIESIFGRYQQSILKKDWYFTGQNVTATKQESKANMEFISANLANLPTKEEICQKYKERREEWNNGLHPKTGKKRADMYYESQNPQAVKLDIMDLIELFWITRKQPTTCTPYGISFKEKEVKYDFMVQKDGLPDVDWLRKNIDKKFTIKYDPSNLGSIALYEDTTSGLRFVTFAETKVVIHRGKQEQEPWEAQFIKDVELEIKRKVRKEPMDIMTSIQKAHGTSAEDYGLNTPAIKGLETSTAAKRKKREKAAVVGIGQITKALSNADQMEEDFDAMAYISKNI